MFRVPIKAESRYPVDRKQVRETVASVLKKNGLKDNVEVNISFVGDRKMTSLNKQYLDRLGTTDVLSFSVLDNGSFEDQKNGFVLPPDEILRLGDIVISFPQARKQAMEFGRTVDEEINKLVEHGLLHLLGKHHE